jgi:dicarboxylate/amino acid:cation (Na+ or H+) symporter, DAACS family
MSAGADRLATRILIGMLAGLVAGVLVRSLAPHVQGLEAAARRTTVQVLEPVGRIFLRLLFFVIVPLIFASLALGILQLGRLDRLGKLAAKTFSLFALNMAIGVALGLVVMNTVAPGRRLSAEARASMEQRFAQDATRHQERSREVRAETSRGPLPWIVDTFMPANLLRAIVDFQVLPLILFALLVGAAGTGLSDDRRHTLTEGLEIVSSLMTTLVDWALRLAPWAVGAMIASTTIQLGLQFLAALGWFTAGVLGAMAVHLFGTLSVWLKLFTRRSPVAFFRSIRTILLTAFSTSSSNATLPTTIRVARENLGVSAPVAGFVLPLGATMNMSGTAIYEGCVVLFIAQVYGVDLSLVQQATLLLLTVLSAVAVAGIPGASLPLIVGLLANFGIPPEGIALVLGVDRILDMARTTLNVAADVVTAVIVDENVAN